MSSTVYNALKDIGFGDLAAVLVIISLFIDLTPVIKFNPIRWILGKLGEAFNHNVNKSIEDFKTEVNGKIDNLDKNLSQRMDNIESKMNQLTSEQAKLAETQIEEARTIDKTEIARLERSILDFSYKLSKKEKFTLDEYRTVMDSYTEYERIVDKYPDMINGKLKVEYDTIVAHFNKNKECGEYTF